MFRIGSFAGVLVVVGCSEWPLHDATPNLVPYGGEVALGTVVTEADDYPCTTQPDDPAASCAPGELDVIAELEPFYGVRVDAHASPGGIYTGVESTEPFVGLYDGDVDWVRVTNPGGSVCLLLQTVPFIDTLWDVVAFPYDPASGDTSGDFVSRRCQHDEADPESCPTDPPLPMSIAAGGCPADAPATGAPGCSWFSSDAEEIALYVAPVDTPATDIEYRLFLFPTTFESGCNDLVPARFVAVGAAAGSAR